MSLLKISENADPNYLPCVVSLPKPAPHPNAERLDIVEVFGNTIIVGKDSYKEGDKVVYFPVESCLAVKFLSWANLLTKPELNADEKTKGFFETKGRVRAVSLRGIPSQGFLYPVDKLSEYFLLPQSTWNVGDTFDTVGEDVLSKKYVKGDTKVTNDASKKSRVPKWLDAAIGYFPRPIRRKAYLIVNAWFNRKAEGIKSRIVEGQFQFHYSTEHLGKNIFVLNPNDDISITAKVHGTSAIFANILVKKTFNPFRDILNFFKEGYFETEEYKLIYSSRSVLKNKRDEKYTEDVWGKHAEQLEGMIPEGYSVYGEIVGYVNYGKMVQKNYDYGVEKGESEFWVYRITYNNPMGGTRELGWDEIEKFCIEHGFTHTPVYYHGPAVDLFDIPLDDKWNENFLVAMKEEYLDKTCGLCTTGVVNEGIVLKINNREKKPVFKFKSPKFILGESAERDAGESNLEEES